MNPRIAIFAAVFEFFALNDPARASSFKFEDYLSPNFRGTSVILISAETAVSSGTSIARHHIGSFTSGQNGTEFYPPFTCTEMQIIDETELLGEPADCD